MNEKHTIKAHVKDRGQIPVTVDYIVSLNEHGTLRSLGFIDRNRNISSTRAPESVPLYLERRSHDLIAETMLNKQILVTGFVSLTFQDNCLVGAQLTPANLPMLLIMLRELTFLKGRVYQLERNRINI